MKTKMNLRWTKLLLKSGTTFRNTIAHINGTDVPHVARQMSALRTAVIETQMHTFRNNLNPPAQMLDDLHSISCRTQDLMGGCNGVYEDDRL